MKIFHREKKSHRIRPGTRTEVHNKDMKTKRQFTAIIQKEGRVFVALCPELDVASQGKTVDEARDNLGEAIELLLEAASPSEIKRRLHHPTYVTQIEVLVG